MSKTRSVPNEPDMIEKALSYAIRFGGIDGAHHKDWVIDQIVRALTDCPSVTMERRRADGSTWAWEAQGESEEYIQLVNEACAGEDGPETYEWHVGIAP